MTACMSRYGHVNIDTTAAERRAKAINVNYHNRFKKLDEVFASDVVGDGTTGIMGPCEAAQTVPYRSGEPLVVGAFGDVNEALEKVLKQVAKAAAAGTDGLTISPLINTERGEHFESCTNNSDKP